MIAGRGSHRGSCFEGNVIKNGGDVTISNHQEASGGISKMPKQSEAWKVNGEAQRSQQQT